MTGTAQIIRADARHLPLADNSVDLIVTSPPYFGLRSYQDGGEHYDGQIGDEPTPTEFVDALLEVTRECMRVLKPSGSMWVNLGDRYAGGGGSSAKYVEGGDLYSRSGQVSTGGKTYGLRPKSLIGVPWRYALRCIDELGIILRAEVIWSKPNGLPESVTDRVRRSHETWFHFTLSPRYYSAVDEIREEHVYDGSRGGGNARMLRGMADGQPKHTTLSTTDGHPLGKLPGSVWTIATQPLKVPAELGVDHFAAFPMEFPRRLILGWSPAGVCVDCGEGRRPVTHKKPMEWRPGPAAAGYNAPGATRVTVSGTMLAAAETTITGYACACPEPTAPTTPGVVLDPFGGTGTTALVAKVLGRTGISVDMSADYCRLAEWRTDDPGEIARAMQVEKPPAQVEGQSMFEFEDVS